MREYKIPCSWELYGTLKIEANSVKEAIEIAKKEEETCPLPDGDYIDASFELDLDEDMINLINKI